MRPSIALVLVLFLAAACAGVQDTPANPKQAELESIVRTYHDKSVSTFNDIAEKELAREYKEKVDSFFSSLDAVENWELTLQSLEVRDITLSDTLYKRVSFYLKNGLDAVPRITFNAVYLSRAETCASDSVYNKLKGIGNLDRVRFSGYALKYGDGEYITDNPLNMSYLELNLLVSDISRIPRYYETNGQPARH